MAQLNIQVDSDTGEAFQKAADAVGMTHGKFLELLLFQNALGSIHLGRLLFESLRNHARLVELASTNTSKDRYAIQLCLIKSMLKLQLTVEALCRRERRLEASRLVDDLVFDFLKLAIERNSLESRLTLKVIYQRFRQSPKREGPDVSHSWRIKESS